MPFFVGQPGLALGASGAKPRAAGRLGLVVVVIVPNVVTGIVITVVPRLGFGQRGGGIHEKERLKNGIGDHRLGRVGVV
jgi:hypothetical protein